MKQVTQTIYTDKGLLELLNQLKTKDFYMNANSILLQIYTSKMETVYINHVLNILKKEMPNAHIAGLTTCSEISNGVKQSHTMVMTFCFFEKSEIIVEEYDCEKMSLEIAAKKLQRKIKKTNHIIGVQIFGTSTKLALDHFIDMIEMKNETFQIFGAGAGSVNYGLDDMFVFGKNIYSKGIVIVIYSGNNLHIEVDYNLGWSPIGKEMEITETIGDLCISKIDNMPAISIYKKYLNLEPNKFFIQNIMEFPLMVKRNKMMITRTPIAYDEKGRIYLPADIHKGEKIRFCYGKTSNILDEIDVSSERMYQFDTQALFLFVCENREVFLQETEEQEINYYRDVNPCVSGCYAYAEIMKNESDGGVLNSALIAIGMREGEASENVAVTKRLMSHTPQKYNEIPLTERLVNFLEAITADLEESNKQLEKMATMDELTKVYNRRRIEQILRYEMSKRSNAGKLSLIIFDIDDFKRINDVYGHDIGDIVLSGLAECLKSKIRQQDSLGRWGGEEFLCILPDTLPEDAYEIAERIRIAASEKIYEKVGSITISLGITTAVEKDSTESIFERADKALYDAKRNGKNRLEVR